MKFSELKKLRSECVDLSYFAMGARLYSERRDFVKFVFSLSQKLTNGINEYTIGEWRDLFLSA